MGRPSKPHYRADRDCWVARIDGQKHILARGRGGRAEATRELRRLLAERDRGGTPSGPFPTLAALCDQFLESVERDKAPLTLEWYLRHLRRFVAKVGPRLLAADVRPYHVAAWLDATTWGDTTKAGAVTAVKRVFSWARKQGLLDVNPIADVERPRARPRATILTHEQAEAIEAATRDRAFRDLLMVLRETGARPSEVARIEAGMIDLERRTVTMQSKTTKATGRMRVIYLTPLAAGRLAELAAIHPKGPLLVNARGQPWTRHAMSHRFGRLRRKVGMGKEATAESYRHLFITDALDLGVPIATVAELMGHTDTEMISKAYSKLYERREHLRAAVEKVRPVEEN